MPCLNEPSFCCLASDTCTPNGCCPTGEEHYGASSCYDLATQVCCPNGGACTFNQVCVENGCCPAGEVPCGTNSGKCYNPTTQVCCEDCLGAGGVHRAQIAVDCLWDCSVLTQRWSSVVRKGNALIEDSCCTHQCCTPIPYCGGDGFCSALVTPTPTQGPFPTTTSSSSSFQFLTPKLPTSNNTQTSASQGTAAAAMAPAFAVEMRPFWEVECDIGTFRRFSTELRDIYSLLAVKSDVCNQW